MDFNELFSENFEEKTTVVNKRFQQVYLLLRGMTRKFAKKEYRYSVFLTMPSAVTKMVDYDFCQVVVNNDTITLEPCSELDHKAFRLNRTGRDATFINRLEISQAIVVKLSTNVQRRVQNHEDVRVRILGEVTDNKLVFYFSKAYEERVGDYTPPIDRNSGEVMDLHYDIQELNIKNELVEKKEEK